MSEVEDEMSLNGKPEKSLKFSPIGRLIFDFSSIRSLLFSGKINVYVFLELNETISLNFTRCFCSHVIQY